jgi:hypothetical protein
MKKCIFKEGKKQMEERFLHGAIYPTTSFYKSIVNCSASGKKRGGDYHVRKAQRPIRFYHLTPPFVLSMLLPHLTSEFIKK